MEILEGVLGGFAVAFTPINLLYVFIGVTLGTIVGVLPGLGPTATIALLLPLTYGVEPTAAIIMLAGIYYGTMYGGTITSVLLALPGEPASVVTVLDGHQMAKQGRAGKALSISAIGSFVGGTIAVVGLTLIAPPLAAIAVKFGPPEFFALTFVGILLVAYLSTGSVMKGLSMAALGLLLATIGSDPVLGTTRFTMGQFSLFEGIDFVPIAMGLFGVGEILHNLEREEKVQLVTTKLKEMLPNRQELKQSAGPIGRGSLIGFLIGVLPGGSGTVSSLASYATEKRRAKDPSRFGKGAIEGVAGPETANNAAATSAFIPLLTLGIPSSGVLALIYGALLIQGITPGPALIEAHPEIFWGVIASMYIGNVVLLALNIPLVGVFLQLLRVRIGILGSFALLITMAGVYSMNNSAFDLWIVLIFGVVGWLMKKTGFEPGPLVLAFVLGPILERAFRQSMLLSDGSFGIFVTRPISGSIFALVAIAFVISLMTSSRRKRSRDRLYAETLAAAETSNANETGTAETADEVHNLTDATNPTATGPDATEIATGKPEK